MTHIPDGFLSAPVSVATLAAAGGLALYASRRAGADLSDRAGPTLGLATALMFAVQMVNFPIVAGTSGHLLGVTLVAVALGPWAAYLVATAVVLAQALLFGDGGISALGANVLNIAAVGALVGYGLYRTIVAIGGRSRMSFGLAAAIAAYVTTVLTGMLAGLEIGLSGTVDASLAVTAMGGVYGLLGLVEATITGAVVAALVRRDPKLLYAPASATRSVRRSIALAGIGLAALIAGIVSIFASTAPDGLERVAIELGFADAASRWILAPLQDYSVAALPAGTTAAGLIGVVFLFLGTLALARALGRPRSGPPASF